MDLPGLGIYRRRTLTNSAAEFVETGAGMDTVAQIGDPDDMDDLKAVSEFVPELDRFVPKGVVVDVTKCYEESQKKMVKFQQTLQSFVCLLRERNVDNELNVEIKNPEELTMADALVIIGKIQEGRNTRQVKSCKDFIHKCYRKAESKRAVAEAVLTMIPNDAYGSVISGGFTLILAAVEKHAEHRKAMQTFLAEIPEQLEKIQRLSQLHLNSLRVHAQRDAVLVSIFVVLERIVDHLTQSWRGKVKTKVKVVFGNSRSRVSTDLVAATSATPSQANEAKQTVTEALEELRAQVDLFQEEIEIADSERLGRVENTSTFVKEGIVAIAKELRASRAELEQNRTWIEKFINGTQATATHHRVIESRKASEEASGKELMHLLFTTFYQFHASNPAFDPKTGKLNYEEMAREESRRLQETTRDTGPAAPPSFQETNKAIFATWLDRLKTQTGLPTHDFLKDAGFILTSKNKLDLDQIDQCNYIMWTAPEYKTWLQINTSPQNPQLLNINPQATTGNQSVNPLSFTTARTAIALRMQQFQSQHEQLQSHSPNWPVLAFFCRQRTMASRNMDIAGPPALVRSLCAQLTEWIVLFRPNIDLNRIKEAGLFLGARRNLPDAMRLFRALLALLKEYEIRKHQELISRSWSQTQGRVATRLEQPHPLTIWLLIDGLAYISIATGGSTSDSHNLISALWTVINEVSQPRAPQRGAGSATGVMMKLLVTDAFGTSPIRHITGPGAFYIHVPGQPTVVGGTRGVLDGGVHMKGDIGALVKDYLVQRERTSRTKNTTKDSEEKSSDTGLGNNNQSGSGSGRSGSRKKGEKKTNRKGKSKANSKSRSVSRDESNSDGRGSEVNDDNDDNDTMSKKKNKTQPKSKGTEKKGRNMETESVSDHENGEEESSTAFSSDPEKGRVTNKTSRKKNGGK